MIYEYEIKNIIEYNIIKTKEKYVRFNYSKLHLVNFHFTQDIHLFSSSQPPQTVRLLNLASLSHHSSEPLAQFLRNSLAINLFSYRKNA